LEEIPDAAIALNDAGVCYSKIGNKELAITYIQKSLHLVHTEIKEEVLNNLRTLGIR